MNVTGASGEEFPHDAPFQHGANWRIFRIRYQGQPGLLRDFLVERYRYGRSSAWLNSFYPQRIRLNNEPVGDHSRVHPGDEIAYRHLRADEPRMEGAGSISPVYEDDWLLALHKPESLPVNPSGVYYYTCLAIMAREATGNEELTPLHRLDLETSGPVLFAKRKADVKHFHLLFQEKAITKRYRALVHGRFPDDLKEITGHIVPDGNSRIHTRLKLLPTAPDGESSLRTPPHKPAEMPPVMPQQPGDEGLTGNGQRPSPEELLGNAQAYAGNGQITRTHVLRACAQGAYSELELEPVTGKTNQLRVHLAHVGHPIVGDKKYHPDENVFLDWVANRDFDRLAASLVLPRQALQCEGVAFLHPFSNEQVVIKALRGSWANRLAPLGLAPMA